MKLGAEYFESLYIFLRKCYYLFLFMCWYEQNLFYLIGYVLLKKKHFCLPQLQTPYLKVSKAFLSTCLTCEIQLEK